MLASLVAAMTFTPFVAPVNSVFDFKVSPAGAEASSLPPFTLVGRLQIEPGRKDIRYIITAGELIMPSVSATNITMAGRLEVSYSRSFAPGDELKAKPVMTGDFREGSQWHEMAEGLGQMVMGAHMMAANMPAEIGMGALQLKGVSDHTDGAKVTEVTTSVEGGDQAVITVGAEGDAAKFTLSKKIGWVSEMSGQIDAKTTFSWKLRKP